MLEPQKRCPSSRHLLVTPSSYPLPQAQHRHFQGLTAGIIGFLKSGDKGGVGSNVRKCNLGGAFAGVFLVLVLLLLCGGVFARAIVLGLFGGGDGGVNSGDVGDVGEVGEIGGVEGSCIYFDGCIFPSFLVFISLVSFPSEEALLFGTYFAGFGGTGGGRI